MTTGRTGGERKPVILLVEDEAGDQELTQRALMEGRIDKELHVAKDGEDALDYLLQRGRYGAGGHAPRPDLILLDLNLPRLDGRQLLARIKADTRLRGIPIVVLTTSRLERDIAHCYAAGANSYFIKPTAVDEIMKLAQTLENYWFETVQLPGGEE
jgi:CheY-like chemotaxis protein